MSYWLECTCSQCNTELDVFVGRWDGKYQCVSCNTWIYVNFDLIYDERNNDEWDIYDYEILTEENDRTFGELDIFECRLCLES